MPIITQAGLTALRSLKYGNDQPGGGSSGEPYITTKIPPPYKQQVDSTNIWNSDNGLIRGGFTGATLASTRDTLRIGKFLVDPPRGPLFIAKQIVVDHGGKIWAESAGDQKGSAFFVQLPIVQG